MKRLVYLLIVFTVFYVSTISSADSGQKLPSISTLHRNGAYGFPQQQAIVLCDRPNLRVSLYNSNHSLYVQSILWKDGDASIGKNRNGEVTGDYSVLMFHIGSSSSRTPQQDRDYCLNPWSTKIGLYFVIFTRENATTLLQKDSNGRGAISYISTHDGGRVRIDSYLLPLADLGLKPGDTVRLCFCAYSPVPEFTVDSTDLMKIDFYYSYHIPVNAYHKVILLKDNAIEIDKLPVE